VLPLDNKAKLMCGAAVDELMELKLSCHWSQVIMTLAYRSRLQLILCT